MELSIPRMHPGTSGWQALNAALGHARVGHAEPRTPDQFFDQNYEGPDAPGRFYEWLRQRPRPKAAGGGGASRRTQAGEFNFFQEGRESLMAALRRHLDLPASGPSPGTFHSPFAAPRLPDEPLIHYVYGDQLPVGLSALAEKIFQELTECGRKRCCHIPLARAAPASPTAAMPPWLHGWRRA